ncbi:MAG: galactokinase [Ignavibacteriaceae bacterium]|nr:galactokinase [Ignavibacteriaceae bacterium]
MKDILNQIAEQFKKFYGEHHLIVKSPGRVNLIGEHTDYNEGFVLPASVNKNIILVLSARDDEKYSMIAYDLNDRLEMSLVKISPGDKFWANYLLGVIDQLEKAGKSIPGFNCVFGGNIPIGAGLSSSAAIETGFLFALNILFDLKLTELEIIKMARQAENDFVGVRCGIMDQFVNIYGIAGKLLKLDCRSLDFDYFPFTNDKIKIVLCDTKVKHSLASSEYNKRRLQCENASLILSSIDPRIKSLRDCSLDLLLENKKMLDEETFNRCHYVIEENIRVESACSNLLNNDFDSFGKCLFESHYGLRDKYQVSCIELDYLVETAAKHSSVFGARMMGGGFGGCTINIVQKEKLEEFSLYIKENYAKVFNTSLPVYFMEITDGTRVIQNNL